jgi:hypothetical protein
VLQSITVALLIVAWLVTAPFLLLLLFGFRPFGAAYFSQAENTTI